MTVFRKKSANIPLMSPLAGDGKEEVKKGTRIKILTPNIKLTKLPILLAQIKALNKVYLFYSNRFIFLKHDKIKKLTELSFASKQKGLKEFKTTLELFHDETKGIEPTNETQVTDIKNKTAALDTASKLYNKLLEIYANLFNKLKHDKKKQINLKT